MKRFFSLLLILCALCMLTACTDGPLVTTATPAPSDEAEPTASAEPSAEPEPTPVMIFEENIVWPETSLTQLVPHFQPTLEIMTQNGDEHFFASFTEYDSEIINLYKSKLLDYGFTVIEQDTDGLYIVSHEESNGLLKVQIFYDGAAGTIQISDNRAGETAE